MSDAFDTNLLGQIKPLDRKLSISKEFVRAGRKQGQNDHKKGSHYALKQPEEGVHEEREGPTSTEAVDRRIIDITI